MNPDSTTWNEAIESLRKLKALCGEGCSKHDLVDVLIAAAILLGINTLKSIKAAVTLCGCNSTHVLIRLSENTGNDPIAKRWWRDEAGCYHNHPD